MSDNEPAFPAGFYTQSGEPHPFSGLTKREWFAGMALSCIYTHYHYEKEKSATEAAREAFELADAMIAEGKKK